MRPGLFRDPAAAFFVRGVAVFRRRSRFGDPGKEENFRCGPARVRCLAPHLAPYAPPCAAFDAVCAALRRIWRRMRSAWPALCGGAYANGIVCAVPRMRTVGACFAPRRVRGRRVPYAALRAAHTVGLRVKFSLFCKRGPFRAPVSLTASCVGACPAGDRSFPRAFARGAARMRADTKRVSVLLYRKGRGFCRAPFRRLAVFIFPPLAAVFIFPPLAAVFSALRAGQYLGQYLVWSFLRICTRRIFPLIVLGSSLTNSTTRGYL